MRNYLYLILIFILLSVVFTIFLVLPKYQNWIFTRRTILEKTFELQSQTEYFEQLKNISEELKKYQESLSKIDSSLPKNPSLPELLNFVQKAGSQAGLSLKGVSPVSTITEEGKISETKINLAMVGGYSEFRIFLSIIEKSARLIEVGNISFSSPQEGPFTFNLAIKIFSY